MQQQVVVVVIGINVSMKHGAHVCKANLATGRLCKAHEWNYIKKKTVCDVLKHTLAATAKIGESELGRKT